MSVLCFGGDGLWARAEDYEIDSGFIVPCGPVTSYDPWGMFDRWRKGDQGAEPPYMKLLNCLNELVLNPGEFNSIYLELISRSPLALPRFEGSAMAASILECCRETGPLGVLPRRMQAFRNDNSGGETYRWSPSGWRSVPNDRGGDLKRVEDGVWISGAIAGSWDDYFDETGAEEVGFVSPLSPPFWSMYREPVVDFVSEAVNLLQIFQGLFDLFTDEEQVLEATKTLNAFLISSKPLIVMNEQKKLACRWITPSLLDAYAVMISLDSLMDPRRVAICSNCGKLFIPADKRANFCSPKCQNTGNKKLTRRRQSLSKKFAAEGFSAEEIAKKVGSTVEAVRKWIAG